MKKTRAVIVVIGIIALVAQSGMPAAGSPVPGVLSAPMPANGAGSTAVFLAERQTAAAYSVKDVKAQENDVVVTMQNLENIARDFFRSIPPVDDYDWGKAKEAVRVQRALDKAI